MRQVGDFAWYAYVRHDSQQLLKAECEPTKIAALANGVPVAGYYISKIDGSPSQISSPIYPYMKVFDTEREARIWLAGEIVERGRRIAREANIEAEKQIKLAMECVDDVTAA